MSLIVHVAPHPDALVERLGALVADPVGAVFDAEVVAVPTRGIERWLTQRIAVDLAARGVGDGICANVEFPSPARLIGGVLAALPGTSASIGAWEGPALTGRLVSVIDATLPEPWMAVLRRHLEGDGAPTANRLAAAAKIASSYSRYARRRPQMIRSWAAGRAVDGAGEPLPEPHHWQFLLWRELRDWIGVASLPELIPEALGPLERGETDPDLPGRVSVYGLTAVDPLDLQVLAAVGRTRDVHLHVLHPSPALWEEAAGHLDGAASVRFRRRSTDPTAALLRHPLLGSWGTESRELQSILAGHQVDVRPVPAEAGRPESVLGRLQDDIRGNRAPRRLPVADGDRSIQIHVCHGVRRQVEVLRDALLHTLAADPTLEPRDVVIMTPDLEVFAPLLEAAFPIGEAAVAAGIPDLRVRIADRSPAAVNPLVRFAAAVLDLADSRLEAGVVRELVTRPVVQQRFGFDGDGGGDIIRLVDDLGVKWGVDADHRSGWGLEGRAEQTWRRGLDRVLAGVFFADSPVRVVRDVAPLDGVEGQEAGPAGHLAAIIDRIVAIRRLLGEPMPVSRWGWAIATAVRLLAAPAWGEEWQWSQLERLLGETFPAAAPGADPRIGCSEARTAVAAWTSDRPSPLHFQSGDVTVCTLLPMRSVPYRVVCLLGMDDDRFPRSVREDGDDLVGEQVAVGDTDRASEDRQLLLDALMAAGERLLVTHAGRDELTNEVVPPSVPVAELSETVEAMVDGEWRFVTTHPLQSFDRRNFTDGALAGDGPWGFDARDLAGARAVQTRAGTPPAGVPSWPAGDPPEVVPLDDLIGFLQHPARHFVRQRLLISIPDLGEIPDDTLTTELAGLGAWAVKDRLLGGLISGHDLDTLVRRERASDTVPPGDLGEASLRNAAASAERLLEAAERRGFRPTARRRLAGLVGLEERAVEGAVDGDPEDALLLDVTPSRLRPGRRLRAFIELAFVTALDPGQEWRSWLIGRSDRHQGDVAVGFGPLGDDPERREAMAVWILRRYVELYDRGHRMPLPMPCATGYAWQRAVTAESRDAAYAAAREQWEDTLFDPESRDPAYELVLPHLLRTEDLVLAGFEHHCERLWSPLLRFMTQEPA